MEPLATSKGERDEGSRPPGPRPDLGPYLERLCGTFGPDHLASDPLEIPRSYRDPHDREAAAAIAASLAFGSVEAIRSSTRALLEALGPSPSAALERMAGGGRPRLRGTIHRWIRGEEMTLFLRMIGRARRESGGLEAFFLAGDDGGRDLRGALASFVARLRELVRPRNGLPEGHGMRTLLTSPASGSACKRWNLMLRWLVRGDDGLDLGLWSRLDPARLTIPLDVHVGRIGRRLGLTRRRTPSWAAAAEITDGLRKVDPRDPTRFDWAISRLGILDRCAKQRQAALCGECALDPVCTL
jgi:uncharacterized protein (TIGR02757 family)